MVNEISSTQQFDEILKNSKTPVFCDFYATWCGPCKMLSPVVDEVAEELAGKLEFIKVNVDENIELAARYGVMTIPTVMIFKNGEQVAKSVGFSPKDEVLDFIEQNK
jgi:thioredoxin 1